MGEPRGAVERRRADPVPRRSTDGLLLGLRPRIPLAALARLVLERRTDWLWPLRAFEERGRTGRISPSGV
ncbi:hypothetical protein ASR50_25815 [Streptomyces sp. 4F]|nr:hypothetical protein ASR50_25815 [Streptomyces sp. 4F]